MMKFAWLCGILLAGCVCGASRAQAPGRDIRSIETGIELGWMADPITFPYELRAFLKGGVVEVHGVVPSAIVRKQALSIARLHAPAGVLDQTDLNAGREKPFIAVPSDKVVSAIKERVAQALPQLAATVGVECDGDGRVTLSGVASTQAEKVALCEILRRVPGCLLVENRVRGGVAAAPTAMPKAAIRLARFEAPAPPNSSATFEQPITNDRTDAMRGTLDKLVPGAGVYVYQVGPRRFQIQFAARTEEEASQIATLIFDRREWKQFHLDVGAHVPR